MSDVTSQTNPATEASLKLEPSEVEALTRMHLEIQNTIQRIGQLEVQKARYMSTISEIEVKAQEMMSQVARRLNIEPGTRWQMGPDGSVIILPRTAQ